MKSFLLILLFFSLIGCEKKESNQESKLKNQEILHIPFSSPIRSLDPRISIDYPTVHALRAIFEGLMRLGQNGELVPGVATSYTISEDQKTYTFYLRDSLWSNGDPVTAHDFEYAWKKAITPEYAQPGAFTFYPILNAASCLQGKTSIDNVGIRALSNNVLTVQLEHPAPYFLYLTSCSSYSPINMKVDIENENWGSFPDKVVSNGPFSLSEWNKNSHLFLTKNSLYWDKNQVRLNGIKIFFIEDEITQFYMFEKEDLHWVGAPMTTLSRDIIKNTNINNSQLNRVSSVGLNWFFINTQKFPLSNKYLRKALAVSINRKEIVDHLLQTGEKPATEILGSSLQLQDRPIFEDGNVALAKNYLIKALNEMGIAKEDLPKIKINCRKGADVLRYVQVIQDQWYRSLGLQVEIQQVEWGTHLRDLKEGHFQIGEMGWVSWINDPIYMLQTFRNRSLNVNYSHWENPVYTNYLDQSDYEVDIKKRKEILKKAEQLLMEEMVVIPIFFNVSHFLKNKNLHGVYVSPLKEVDFKFAYFSSE